MNLKVSGPEQTQPPTDALDADLSPEEREAMARHMQRASEEKIDSARLRESLRQDELTAAEYLRQRFHVTDTKHASTPWEDELAAMDERPAVVVSERERMLDAEESARPLPELFDEPIFDILAYDAADAGVDGETVRRLVGDAPRVAGRTANAAVPVGPTGFTLGILVVFALTLHL